MAFPGSVLSEMGKQIDLTGDVKRGREAMKSWVRDGMETIRNDASLHGSSRHVMDRCKCASERHWG